MVTATINKTNSFSEKIKSYFKNLSTEEKLCYGLLVVLLILIYTIRSKFESIPFERDEGAYAYYGKLLLEGKIPYKDFYEQKFPGLFYFYGMMVALFGDTAEGLHFGFMLLNMLVTTLLFFTAKLLFNPIAAIITATTYAILSLTPNLSGFTIQAENAVVLFACIGLLFYSLARKTEKLKYYVFMGLAMGMAFMSKTSGIFMVAAGGLVIITDHYFTSNKKPFKNLFYKAAIYSVSAIAISLLFILLVVFKGAYAEMLFWTIEIPKKYVSTMPFSEGKKYLEYTYNAITENYKLYWQHAYLAIPFLFVKGIDLRLKIFGIVFAAFSFLTIVPGYYFYGHYWIQTIPGLAILSGITYFALHNLITKRLKLIPNAFNFIYLGIFMVITLIHLNKNKSYYFHPNYDRIMRAVYGNNPFPESVEIAKYINRNAKPEDGLVIIGSEPQIYFYTKKKCPSRHAYFSAIVNNIPEHKEWQREFVDAVEKASPRYVVFFNHPISLLVQANTDKFVFEWFNKYVTENYKTVGLVDMPDNTLPTYVWDSLVNTYKPTGPNYAVVFEKK